MTNKVVTQSSSFLIQALTDVIKSHSTSGAFFLLALSGGVDSMVLLHALVSIKKLIPFKLHALHVHHGLSEHADEWAQHCSTQCAILGVPLQVVRVNVNRESGLGIEAEARALRYQALMRYHEAEVYPDFILTAHHQDDQAETFLLQLFRGAGVKGLSSMAVVDTQRRILRPLLKVSRAEVLTYATEHNLEWCEDDSNTNIQYERNFLRHEILPILDKRVPAIHRVLSRSASHLAEASDLLESLAEIDANSLLKDNSLCVQGLIQLALPRAKNVIRWWLARNQISMPNTQHLNELIHQLLNAKSDAKVCIKLQNFMLRRYQQRVYLVPETPVIEFDLLWQGESKLALPNGGELVFNVVRGKGISLKLGIDKLRITNRKGGETFKPDANRPTRTLKHLLQEANIPPWQREQMPLVYWQDTLAFVPLIGVYHELKTPENESGIEIIWKYSA